MRAFLLASVALIASSTAFAAPAASGDDTARVAAASAPAPADSTDLAGKVDDEMDNYVAQSGLGDRSDRGELQILRGASTVMVSTSDPKWVAYRAIAYKDALLDATEEFIKSEGLRISTDTTREFYQAAHQEPPPFDKGQAPGQAAELIRKLLAVGNARLDGELQKLGVDPKQFADAPESQRHVQLRVALNQKTLRSAMAEIVGLTPVQTFEGTNGHGVHRIGVVAVVSPRLREFAQQVLHAQGDFEPDPAKAQDLKTLFGVDKTNLLRDFGVRRMYDAEGLPVIVSFSQWAPEGTRGEDPSVTDSYRQVAFDQAESQADAQIADFLDGSAEFKEQSDIGQSLEKVAERMPDDYAKQDATLYDLTNGLMKQMQTRSQIQLTGVQTVRRWTAIHPVSGRPVVGIIRVWSAASEKRLRALRDDREGTPAGQAGVAPHEDATVKTGNDYMKPADF